MRSQFPPIRDDTSSAADASALVAWFNSGRRRADVHGVRSGLKVVEMEHHRPTAAHESAAHEKQPPSHRRSPSCAEAGRTWSDGNGVLDAAGHHRRWRL